MKPRISGEEFDALRKPWDDKVAAVIDQRFSTNYSRASLTHFTDQEASSLRAFAHALVPESEGLDLLGWLDHSIGSHLGRGDWKPGMPPELELYKEGARLLDELSSGSPFESLPEDQAETTIRSLQNDETGKYFMERFFERILHGYYSHPRVWMRIGFYGPSYPEGYIWLRLDEVQKRHERAAGWDRS